MGRAVRCVVLRGVHQHHHAVFGAAAAAAVVHAGVVGVFGVCGVRTAADGFACCEVVDAIIGGAAATDVCAAVEGAGVASIPTVRGHMDH